MNPRDKPEYIICAAIHYEDGKEYVHQPKNITTGFVVCGRRHHNIIAVVSQIAGMRTGDSATQGFLTSKDRFVDRNEGGQIAYQNGQCGELTNCLFSEDLY